MTFASKNVIGAGVHIKYNKLCLLTNKVFESYFYDRLTLSNIRGRTSCRIYRLALLLCAPETISSSSKSLVLFDTSVPQPKQWIVLP